MYEFLGALRVSLTAKNVQSTAVLALFFFFAVVTIDTVGRIILREYRPLSFANIDIQAA